MQPADCIEDLAGVLAEVELGDILVEVCEGEIPPVKFALSNLFLQGERVDRQGGVGGLMAARQPDYLRQDDNLLSIVLVPKEGDINWWSVQFMDAREPGVVRPGKGNVHYFVWSPDQRLRDALPPGMIYTDDSVRLLECVEHPQTGCVTYHDIPICEGYQYPKMIDHQFSHMRQPRPTLTVYTETPEEAEIMFERFEEANFLAQEIVQEIMEISCR